MARAHSGRRRTHHPGNHSRPGRAVARGPTGSEPATDYEFTVIELRLNAKGLGEGKTSLTSKVIIDNDAKTIALENYAAAPVILQNVKRS